MMVAREDRSGPPPRSAAGGTVDPGEVARFSALAAEWWEPDGKFRPLHRLNPVRLAWIRDRLCGRFGRDAKSLRALDGLEIVDVGCGGGLISEPLARMGARVTAIDASETSIGVAASHASEGGLAIEYRAMTAEALVAEGRHFDAVIALEIVEHVADVALFLRSCVALARPGGALVFATLNRTAKSFLFAIVGAEYVLRWLPRGTHRWDSFVRPSELAEALAAEGAPVAGISGLAWDPVTDEWRLARDLSVNYMLYAEKPRG